MNKKGEQSLHAIIIEGGVALFVGFIFFGIVFPSLNEISNFTFPGFSFLTGLSFVIIIIAIIVKVVSTVGESRWG